MNRQIEEIENKLAIHDVKINQIERRLDLLERMLQRLDDVCIKLDKLVDLWMAKTN